MREVRLCGWFLECISSVGKDSDVCFCRRHRDLVAKRISKLAAGETIACESCGGTAAVRVNPQDGSFECAGLPGDGCGPRVTSAAANDAT